MKRNLLALLFVSAFSVTSSPVCAQLFTDQATDLYQKAIAGDAHALSTLRQNAAQGQVDAQSNLGLMYSKGQGVPQNYVEAVKWFRKAADQGHAKAQRYLGFMYFKGQGVPQNYSEAVKLYRMAVDQGHAAAQCNLGGMYAQGFGVPQDSVQAYKWTVLSKAASKPGGEAYNCANEGLDNLAKSMTATQIARAQQEASAWSPRNGKEATFADRF